MKRDQKLVINGYSVPGGVGRIAVAAAVDLIKRNPGVRQSEVLKRSVDYSGLNMSTASWITSPGRGPSGLLWSRSGSPYLCFPNVGTEQFNLNPLDLAISYVKSTMSSQLQACGLTPQPGDILELRDSGDPNNRIIADRFLFVNYTAVLPGIHNSSGTHSFTDISYLDSPSLYGHGMPQICMHGISDGKTKQFPLTWLRAKPVSA